VEGVDPVSIAGEIEACMYAKLGPASGVGYKNKLRSLLFNLKVRPTRASAEAGDATQRARTCGRDLCS
jgi:hypothetical protein